MKDLFDKAVAAEISTRIHQLTADAKPVWGKMNVSQMLSHIQVPLLGALGEIKLKRTLIGFLFGGIAKKQMVNEKPFKENLPTDPTFIRKGEHDFDLEKTKLLEGIDKFVAAGPTGISKEPHPFFGKLTPAEWSTLMWKHLDHHLRQFGV